MVNLTGRLLIELVIRLPNFAKKTHGHDGFNRILPLLLEIFELNGMVHWDNHVIDLVLSSTQPILFKSMD